MQKFLIYNGLTGKYLASDGYTSPAWWTVHEAMGRKFTQEEIDTLRKHWPQIRNFEIERVE